MHATERPPAAGAHSPYWSVWRTYWPQRGAAVGPQGAGAADSARGAEWVRLRPGNYQWLQEVYDLRHVRGEEWRRRLQQLVMRFDSSIPGQWPQQSPTPWYHNPVYQHLGDPYKTPDFSVSSGMEASHVGAGSGTGRALGGSSVAGVVPGGAAAWGGSAARGWAAAAAFLALLLLLLRLGEKCAHVCPFRLRKRNTSEILEWPVADVLATSHRQTYVHSNIEDLNGFPTDISIDNLNDDLPPPYSTCANVETNVRVNKMTGSVPEEPPPPYSTCCVAYSNPKDGIPSVHFYNTQRQNLFESNISDRDRDEAQTSAQGNGCEVNSRLVFRDGRIVESPPNVTEHTSADHENEGLITSETNGPEQANEAEGNIVMDHNHDKECNRVITI